MGDTASVAAATAKVSVGVAAKASVGVASGALGTANFAAQTGMSAAHVAGKGTSVVRSLCVVVEMHACMYVCMYVLGKTV